MQHTDIGIIIEELNIIKWGCIKAGADISGVFTIGADSSTIGNHRLPSASAGKSVPIVKNYNIIIFDVCIDNYRCRMCFRSRMMNSKPADTRKAVRRRSQDLACSIKLADLSTRCTNQSASSTSGMTNGNTNFSRLTWWQTTVTIFILWFVSLDWRFSVNLILLQNNDTA